MNDQLSKLIESIGMLAEIAALIRDALMKNGFTREEAVGIAGECINSMLAMAGGKNDDN